MFLIFIDYYITKILLLKKFEIYLIQAYIMNQVVLLWTHTTLHIIDINKSENAEFYWYCISGSTVLACMTQFEYTGTYRMLYNIYKLKVAIYKI